MKHKIEIKYLDINEITGYINNSRLHTQKQIDQIKSSISEFGMCNPIGLHKGVIVFGHGRWEALKQLSYKEVPTIDLSYLTESQKKALIIADNKIAENSSWDIDILKLEIETVKELECDFNLDVLGFDDIELLIQDGDDVDDSVFDDEIVEEKDGSIKLNVICDTELDKKQLKEELLSRGFLCR